MKNQLTKQVLKYLFWIVVIVVACRFTKGAAAALLFLGAIGCALQGKMDRTMMIYALFPFMMIMNPIVLPKSGLIGYVLRLSPLIMGVLLAFTATQRPGKHTIPVQLLWLYLAVAIISSVGGYCPAVSYLKIFNFAIVLMGVQLGFKNLHSRPRDVERLRIFLLALAGLLVLGSLFVRIFMPGAAYLSALEASLRDGTAAGDAVASQLCGISLFCGITNQSQTLATILPTTLTLVICDMLFVERKITGLHSVIILIGLPMVRMTGSRVSFLIMVVGVWVVYFYCLRKVSLPKRIKNMLSGMMTFGLVACLILGIVSQVRNQSISKWLRKTDDISGDTRGLTEAFTASRQGKVELNMHDFRANPVIGTGFQVTEDMKDLYKDQFLVLSAPMEKGVLPLMVLGETGVIGGIVFALFIINFYSTCIRKRFFCLLAMMTCFITANMAEATFFSPGGQGGVLWVVGIGGGFVIDTIVYLRKQRGTMPAPGFYPAMGMRGNV